ncbi:unnamed protein product [Anisakis simplex]|uniref:DUF356 domain-containing protein n=1 Tax=Anisakis simplex TaxID=6269 RepID=A0A0M3JA95_ANISI|nr:unnamed protein product [Anisakis simplex]
MAPTAMSPGSSAAERVFKEVVEKRCVVVYTDRDAELQKIIDTLTNRNETVELLKISRIAAKNVLNVVQRERMPLAFIKVYISLSFSIVLLLFYL